MSNPVRACLLTGVRTLPQWYLESLKHAVETTPLEISLIVIRDDANVVGQDPDRLGLDKLKGKLKSRIDPQQWERIEKTDLFENIPVSECTIVNQGSYRVGIPDHAVDRIGYEADIVFQFGFGILTGDILDATEHGILSFHHGDIRQYRGGPPGFWEFLHGEDKVGITLQRLTEDLDGGEIILYDEIDISDAASWKVVRQRLYDRSTTMLSEGIQNVIDEEFTPVTPDDLGDLYSRSAMIDIPVVLRYGLRRMQRLMK